MNGTKVLITKGGDIKEEFVGHSFEPCTCPGDISGENIRGVPRADYQGYSVQFPLANYQGYEEPWEYEIVRGQLMRDCMGNLLLFVDGRGYTTAEALTLGFVRPLWEETR